MDEYIASGVVFNSLDEGKVIYGTVHGDLIRCKNCADYYADLHECADGRPVKEDDFCSRAERKEE